MTLRIIGAGLGRTGTKSLKSALETLLEAPCYHMLEVFAHPEHLPAWTAAMHDEAVDWASVFDGFAATVDWPGGGVWRSILAANPDAVVLLSTRATAEVWWTSASRTIFLGMDQAPPEGSSEWHDMALAMMERFTPEWRNEAGAKAAYERHNAAVRAEVPADQLIDWQPGDGWEPLCTRLGVAVPDVPFPHENTTAAFRANFGLTD